MYVCGYLYCKSRYIVIIGVVNKCYVEQFFKVRCVYKCRDEDIDHYKILHVVSKIVKRLLSISVIVVKFVFL